MLKVMPIPRVLRMKSSPCVEGPTLVAVTCSPVDWMYVTRKPAIATLFMIGNHSKTDSIGLQYQSNVVVSKRNHHKT